MIERAARDYAGFLVEVKARIQRGQYQALVAEISRAKNLVILGRCKDLVGI
jgi:predicted DNA-binding protein